MTFELLATIRPGTVRSVGFRIHAGEDEFTEIAYYRNSIGAYVDRAKSRDVNFHKAFPERHTAPARIIDGELAPRIFVDRQSDSSLRRRGRIRRPNFSNSQGSFNRSSRQRGVSKDFFFAVAQAQVNMAKRGGRRVTPTSAASERHRLRRTLRG